jgi:predicted transcriptional regulator of viral defense system
MQTLTEKILELSPPGGLFNETVVHNLFPNHSEGARKVLVFRAIKKGEILRLKPGFFLLAERYRRTHPHPFVIASMLHAPSHISLESSLSFHGLIREAVFQVSSVTIDRSRTFRTPVGIFSYSRIPVRYPRAGVKAVNIDASAWVFIATPLRAIADMIYLRKKIQWKKDGIDFLTSSLRIETDDLVSISFDELNEIHSSFRDTRTKEYLSGLYQEQKK